MIWTLSAFYVTHTVWHRKIAANPDQSPWLTQLVYIAQRTPELAIVVFIGTNPSLRNLFRVTSEKFHLPEVLVQNALCAAETADEAQSSTNFLVQLYSCVLSDD